MPSLHSRGISLGDLEERSERKTGTSGDKGDGEVSADEVSRRGKKMSLQASASNAARYCFLKVLNTFGDWETREIGDCGGHSALCTQRERVRLPKRGGGRDLGSQCEFD